MLGFLTIILVVSVVMYPLINIIFNSTNISNNKETPSEEYLRDIRDYEAIRFFRDLNGK